MPTEFGQMIRDARHARGLTLEDLAAFVGVTPGALSHIESGRRLPNPSNAVRIARALGISDDHVMAALDMEHSHRRRSSVEVEEPAEHEPPHPRAALGVASIDAHRGYVARPIEELFGQPAASEPAASAPSAPAAAPLDADWSPALRVNAAPSWSEPFESSARYAASWSPDAAQRMAALEQLADTAAVSIRTLRGLLDDEDPDIRRAARRLLRGLDVRLPEE